VPFWSDPVCRQMKTRQHDLPPYRWHTKALMWLLAIWGAWSAFAVSYALLTAPRTLGLGLFDYYVLFSVPVVILLTTYLLFTRNRFAYCACAVLPIIYLVIGKRLYPDIDYIFQLPPLYLICAVFFAGCAIYCFALWRKGYLG
jgi:hypothetical protein